MNRFDVLAFSFGDLRVIFDLIRGSSLPKEFRAVYFYRNRHLLIGTSTPNFRIGFASGIKFAVRVDDNGFAVHVTVS